MSGTLLSNNMGKWVGLALFVGIWGGDLFLTGHYIRGAISIALYFLFAPLAILYNLCRACKYLSGCYVDVNGKIVCWNSTPIPYSPAPNDAPRPAVQSATQLPNSAPYQPTPNNAPRPPVQSAIQLPNSVPYQPTPNDAGVQDTPSQPNDAHVTKIFNFVTDIGSKCSDMFKQPTIQPISATQFTASQVDGVAPVTPSSPENSPTNEGSSTLLA